MLLAADAWPRGYPERVGRYELLAPIGAGGMATVFLARAPVAGSAYREAAIKLLNPSFDGSTADLLAEAELAAHIRHPNVVSVLGVEQDGPWTALALDYVKGETAAGLLRAAAGPLPVSIAGRVLADALAGLHAAHETRRPDGAALDLVHRDFSPQNILVDVDGPSRLTDFGVAKALSSRAETRSGVIKGKIAFMAPEQVRGEPLDRRCDVWAAGVVAWEMLAGRRMYQHDEPLATMLAIAQEAPPRLRDARPDLPALLDEAVAWALARERERRCPSALALRQCLLDAFRAAGPVAEHDEVGAFVRRVAGPRLAERRAFVERTLARRASAAALAPTSPAAEAPPAGEEAPTAPAAAIAHAAHLTHTVPAAPLLEAAHAPPMDPSALQLAPAALAAPESETGRATTLQIPDRARRARRAGSPGLLLAGAAGLLALGTLGVAIVRSLSSGGDAAPAGAAESPAVTPAATAIVDAKPSPAPAAEPSAEASAASPAAPSTAAPATTPIQKPAATPRAGTAPRRPASSKPGDDLLPFRKTPQR